MRAVTRTAVAAFMAGRAGHHGRNTLVEVRPFKAETRFSAILKLHGNVIARRSLDGAILEVCDGNWQTNTTKERLNGIPGVQVVQRKGLWYLNGVEWDGGWQSV